MRAVAVTPLGEPAVLDIATVPAPSVRSRAGENQGDGSSVNFRDMRARQAVTGGQRMPHIAGTEFAGTDFAGTVVETAAGVEGLAIGDRVAGLVQEGAHAEYLVTVPSLPTAIPAGLDDAAAATLPTPGLSASFLIDLARWTQAPPSSLTPQPGSLGCYLGGLLRRAGAHEEVLQLPGEDPMAGASVTAARLLGPDPLTVPSFLPTAYFSVGGLIVSAGQGPGADRRLDRGGDPGARVDVDSRGAPVCAIPELPRMTGSVALLSQSGASIPTCARRVAAVPRSWPGWRATSATESSRIRSARSCRRSTHFRGRPRRATAQRILDAARAEFGEHGLEAATIRGIARRAMIDPSLVMQHYGSKAALFNSAIQLGDAGAGEVQAHLHDVLDVRLAVLPPETRALVRSMLTAPEATESMRAFLDDRAANLSRAMSGDDADLRAALIVSSILGLTITRHFLPLDAFARASDDEIARVARPWITTGVDPATGQHSPTSTRAG